MSVSPQEKEQKLSSMSAAVKVVIDNYPVGHEFYGNELKDDVVKIYPDALNMYPDTILKMARRHRRASYIAIDHNNSLYKKVAVKSIVEQIKELAPKEAPIRRSAGEMTQGFLFPNQGFLGVFFALLFGFLFISASAFGLPLTQRDFNISISSSSSTNIELRPMYRDGAYPARTSLLRVAAFETGFFAVDIRFVTSSIVNSILSLYRQKKRNQVLNVLMSVIGTIRLYRRIVIFENIFKNSENSLQTLAISPGVG